MQKAKTSSPSRQLSLFDSTSIIVGIIIGAGIYETSPLVAANVGSPGMLLLVWALGGAIALVGALCYAELATTYPSEGGDYLFLSRAFGARFGFTFAWAEYWIIRPGNVGMMAFVFARFAHDLFPLRPSSENFDFVTYAGVAVTVLTALNLIGVRAGKTTQNVLTVAKVVGLVAVFVVGVLADPASPTLVASDTGAPNYRLALIFVLFTYGGWNEISYVAAEVRDPNRNIVRALICGTVAVTVVYIMVNIAFLNALGLQATGATQTAAAEVLRLRLGPMAGRIMSALVCISCLGAINGLLFTGSRVFYAAGTDHRLIAWLGHWNARLDTPLYALLVQLAVTLGLVIGFGSEQGFQQLLIFTTPVYWIFATMVGVSLFVLRVKDADIERPHRVILYPITPALFCCSCLFVVYSSLDYAWQNRSIESYLYPTIAVVLAGAVLSRWSGAKSEFG